ncbi:MAG: metal ABC transporter ATP-binding protein [Thermovirgaceae bacterium]|nr:metal ABC transporter ATP-binding protein [Thermovirgaceae bacterium]
MAHVSNTESAAVSDRAIVFRGVSAEMDGIPILEDVSASAPPGSCTAIVGPNGAGKTTLLLALLGEIPFRGEIRLFGVANTDGLPVIGYIPQRLSFDRGTPVTVKEFLSAGIQRSPLWFGVPRQYGTLCLEALERVRCAHLAERRLGALSGGEIQRVLLALALMRDPKLLILDEPAAGVDPEGGLLFCELLERIRRERDLTLLMVSHDLATVTHHATHVICLNRRVLAEGSPGEVLTRKTLAATFGVHMGLVQEGAIPGNGVHGEPSCGVIK